MNEYIEYARNKNISFLWLTIGETNIAARKLYEKCNFELQCIENRSCKYVLNF